MDIGFVDLGVMGLPMAGYLQAAGHSFCVYNRTVEKAHLWAEKCEGQLGGTPQDVAARVDIVRLCVGNDEDVRSVLLSKFGVLAGVPAGGVIIDHTTALADLAQAERRGLSLPLTRLVDGFYAEVQTMGGGRWDTSSLLARMLQTADNQFRTRNQ
jgi:3-hydroxyisobutyrate dehydrogenase